MRLLAIQSRGATGRTLRDRSKMAGWLTVLAHQGPDGIMQSNTFRNCPPRNRGRIATAGDSLFDLSLPEECRAYLWQYGRPGVTGHALRDRSNKPKNGDRSKTRDGCR